MQKLNFDEVINKLVEEDRRYEAKAYRFVREGLDYTMKLHKKSPKKAQRHVTGKELLEGLRDFTLREFGPMSKTVLNEWGIMQCRDFGEIVFNLVQHGVLGKSEDDRIEDFENVYEFDDAFVKPYTPAPMKLRGESDPTSSSKGKRSSKTSLNN
jgi:uncharacterized repeat protein (TIGR04138 family)